MRDARKSIAASPIEPCFRNWKWKYGIRKNDSEKKRNSKQKSMEKARYRKMHRIAGKKKERKTERGAKNTNKSIQTRFFNKIIDKPLLC